MDGRMYVLLVFVWCSLDTGGLLMVATAEPAVSAVILTPEADRKEGGQVDMRCTATNLKSEHIVEWRFNETTLRWNDTTIAANVRFMYDTTYPQTGITIQDFTITDLQIDDYNEYICNIRAFLHDGGSIIVATSSVILSPPSFPICSHDRPITVDAGTELHMRCLSNETDNPAAIIGIYPTTNSDSDRYTWTSSNDSDNVIWSLDLTVDVGDDDVAFNCTISTGTCTIGPIQVTESTSTSTIGPTSYTDTPPASSTSVITGAVAGGVVVILLIVVLIVICRRRGLCNKNKKLQIPKANNNSELKSDPPDHSKSSLSHYPEVDMHDQTQINHKNSHQCPVAMVSRHRPMSGSSPEKTAAESVAELNKHSSTISFAGRQKPDKPSDINTDQSYSNPAFNSKDSEGSERPYASMKPVAKVRPNSATPKKPQPYKPKPADERTRNITSHHDGEMLPSQAPPDTPQTHPNTGTPTKEEAPSPPYEVTYAQVSISQRHNGSQNNLGSQDHVVYADLNLQ